MISVGDFVFDTIEKANVQVLEKIEAWGYISYKVFNPATGRVYKANEEQLSSSGNTMQYDENYLRKVCIICLLCRILIAVTVNSNNAICIFVYDFSFWIHTEGTHQIFIL